MKSLEDMYQPPEDDGRYQLNAEGVEHYRKVWNLPAEDLEWMLYPQRPKEIMARWPWLTGRVWDRIKRSIYWSWIHGGPGCRYPWHILSYIGGRAAILGMQPMEWVELQKEKNRAGAKTARELNAEKTKVAALLRIIAKLHARMGPESQEKLRAAVEKTGCSLPDPQEIKAPVA